jgi:hypothetical protein
MVFTVMTMLLGSEDLQHLVNVTVELNQELQILLDAEETLIDKYLILFMEALTVDGLLDELVFGDSGWRFLDVHLVKNV